MLRRSLLTGLLLAATASTGPADDEWIKITSANFELYTATNEKRGRKVVQHFEAIRQFFLDVTEGEEASTLPVRIIGFRSRKQFEPYRINEFATAFYTQSRSRDYIVMSDISSEHYDTAVHEYMHLIQRNTGRKYPIWMNEGLAQLYETLTPVGKKVRVGDVQPGKYQLLQTKNWLDLETVFNVDYESAHYNEKKRAGIFYAESWALTHMLNLSPEYTEINSYAKLVAAVVAGESTSAAIQHLYGKGVGDVYRDLRDYIREGRLFAALYDIKLEKAAQEFDVRPAGELESGLVLADLLGVMRDREEEAAARYFALSERHPDSAEVFEGLGYLAIRRRDDNKAREHLGRAVDLGSDSAKVYRDYAYFLQQAGEPAPKRIPLLEKALLLQPDDRDTRTRIAFLYLREKSYIQALRHLAAVKNVEEEKAFRLFDAMGFAYYELERFEDARKALERAEPYAKSPDEKLRVERMLEAIDYRMNPRPVAVTEARALSIPEAMEDETDERPELRRKAPADSPATQPAHEAWRKEAGVDWLRVEGVLETLECAGSTANMHVRSGSDKLVFAILDPTAVVVRDGKTLEFRCGAQGDRPIAVEFEKSDETGPGVAGVVRALEFK